MLTATDAQQDTANVNRVVLSPAVVQSNSKFNQHTGVSLGYARELAPGFALTVTGQYNWDARSTDFADELVSKTRMTADLAAQTSLRWHALAGFEVVPFTGKLLAGRHLQVGLGVGVGLGGTGWSSPSVSPMWFDTGVRFLAGGAVSARVELVRNVDLQVAFHLQHFASNRPTHVNGCSEGDLTTMSRAIRLQQPYLSVGIGEGCRAESFRQPDDVMIAESMLTTSEWRASWSSRQIVALHLVSVGLSARF